MNNFLSVVLRESPLVTPFVPIEKCNPLAGAAAIGAAGSILGGIFGLGSQSSANSTNKAIAEQNAQLQRETNAQNAELAREANAQNYKMFKEQNQFNLDMWNKENEYNSPSNQVARLRAAGINPAFAQGVNAGVASQLTSASSPAAERAEMTAPQLNYQRSPYDFGFIGNAVSAYRQAELWKSQENLNNANAANVENETREKVKTFETRSKQLQALADKEGVLGDIARTQLAYEGASLKYRLASVMNDVRMQSEQFKTMQEQREGYRLQNMLAEVQLAYAPKLNDAQLRQYYTTVQQLKAQIGLINANKLLTDEQRETEIKKRVGVIIDNGMRGLDYQLKEQTQKVAIQSVFDEGEMLNFERRNQKSGERLRRLTSIIPFVNGYQGMQPHGSTREYHSGGYNEVRW